LYITFYNTSFHILLFCSLFTSSLFIAVGWSHWEHKFVDFIQADVADYQVSCPVCALGEECALIHLLLLVLYKLFVCLRHFLTFCLLIYFLTHLRPDLSTFRIEPFHYQAGGRRKQPNLALAFVFILWYILLQMHFCFCCVRSNLSVLSQEIGWKNVPEMTYFVSINHLLQSIALTCLFVFNSLFHWKIKELKVNKRKTFAELYQQ